jgi:recombination protein RecA
LLIRFLFTNALMQAAALRTQIESALGTMLPTLHTPDALREPPLVERVPSGFVELDAVTGGLPRGGITEIYGPVSSGRTSLGLSVLAQRTGRGEVCAWVDAGDSFDPCSAQRMGVALHRLLWVRCRDLEQSVQAAGLILGSAGFGLVVLDLGGVPLRALHRLPLSLWFRFRRAVEHTPTLLLVLAPEPCAKSCASLILRLRLDEASWSTLPDTATFDNPPTSTLTSALSRLRERGDREAVGEGASRVRGSPETTIVRNYVGRHTRLLQGSRFSAEVIRSRFQRPSEVASRIHLRTEINYPRRSCEV